MEALGGEGEEVWAADLRAAGTLRLMFSRASLRSTWKSGWRKVQLCVGSEARGKGGKRMTHVLAELVVVRVLDLELT